MDLIHKILPSMEHGSCAVYLILDYTTSFHTLNRDLLLKNLTKLGVKGLALKFVHSYVEGQRELVLHCLVVSAASKIFI